MINKYFQYIVICIALRKKSQRQTCLGSGNVSEPDMSQGWTCLGRLELLLYKKKAEKEKNYLRARLFQALWGRTCLRARLLQKFWVGSVQKLQGRKCLAARSVQKFRTGSVSRLDLVRGRMSLESYFYF